MNNRTKIITLSAIIISIIGVTATAAHAYLTRPTTPELHDNAPPGLLDHQEQLPDKTSQNLHNNPPSNQPNDRREFKDQSPLTTWYIIIIAVFCAILSLSSIYLIMNRQSRNFLHNPDKLTIYILSNIISIATLTTLITLLATTLIPKSQPLDNATTKDQISLDESNVANSNNINLSQQTSSVTITKAGTYTFTGQTTHSIIVNAPNENVTLILDNATISSTDTAAIIGLAASQITITSADNSKNVLSDGGNSEYDGCIFSNAKLIFDGNGTLEVNGNQNEGEGIATEAQDITFKSGTYLIASNDDGINAGGDGATITFNGGSFYIDANGDGIDSNKNAIINGGTIFVAGSDLGGDSGIDTDDGFAINGGTVIALGTDMMEAPLTSSKQKSIAFTLDNTITKDTIVTLMKGNQPVISFSASKSFKTIIISSDKLVDGDYTLYTGGTHDGKLIHGIYTGGTYKPDSLLKVSNQTTFTINNTVNTFGHNSR